LTAHHAPDWVHGTRGERSAVLNGGVNPQKGKSPTTSSSTARPRAYGAQTPLTPAGNGTATINVSQAIGGLGSNTTYHYRILATSAAAAAPGADHTFTTPKIPLSLQIAGASNPVLFGDPFSVAGTLSGTGAAGGVGFQLLRPGLPSVNKGGAFIVSGTPTVSRFSTIVRVRHGGVYQALALIADGSHVSAYSAPLRIR
jgi:hypothetical protein